MATLPELQREEIITTLNDPIQSIALAAKHIRDLKDVDFPATDPANLSKKEIQIIGARYNQGPDVKIEDLNSQALSYGERITKRWGLFGVLLEQKPLQLEYQPIQNSIINPANQFIANAIQQAESSLRPTYGVKE